MSRDLTRRRHGRHRSFDRVRQPAGDSLAFIEAETVRLDPSEGQPGVHDAMHLVQGEGSFSTFEQVQAATDPTDIGLTPSFTPQTTSIDFNGVDELMANTSFNTLGVANTWSLMMWFRQKGDADSLASKMGFISIVDTGGNNLILVRSLGDFANDPLSIVIRASTGVATIKDFRFNRPTFFPFDVWHQAIITWDGATDILTVYENGSAIVPSSTPTDTTGTMTDTARTVQIADNSGAQRLSGFIHSAALWDVDIGSAVAEIFNGGIASTFDLQAASFAANLQHWWRLGRDPADLGKDEGNGFPLIDVDVNSVNIDASDIVSESPL